MKSRRINELAGAAGFLLILTGGGSADSGSMILPALMLAAGTGLCLWASRSGQEE